MTTPRSLAYDLAIIGLMVPPAPAVGAWLPDDLAGFERAAKATADVAACLPSVPVDVFDGWSRALRLARFVANCREPGIWPGAGPGSALMVPVHWGLRRVHEDPQRHTFPTLRPRGDNLRAAVAAARMMGEALTYDRARGPAEGAADVGSRPRWDRARSDRIWKRAQASLANFERLIESTVGRPRLVLDADQVARDRSMGRLDGA